MTEKPELHVYKNFDLQDMRMEYQQLRWTRKYNDVSTFELIMAYDQEFYDLLMDETIYQKRGEDEITFYRPDIKEACFMEDINVYDSIVTGETKMIARGKGIENMLSRRVAKLTMSGTVENIVRNLLQNNITVSGDRKILDFEISNLATSVVSQQNVDYKDDVEVLGIINKLVQPLNIGYKVEFDPVGRKYVFILYEGKYDPSVVYDKNHKNVDNEDYYFLTRDYKNIVYVDGAPVGNAKGLYRREYATRTTSGESATVTGGKTLEEKKQVKSADVGIIIRPQFNDTTKQWDYPAFVYLTDWNLGDIITFHSVRLNTEIQENVLQVNEFFGHGEIRIDAVFGTYLPIRR